jgi:hypothetical protein
MPLMLDPAPRGTEKAIDAALSELVGQGAISFGRETAPTASAPVPVFHLGADAIAGRKGLEAATPVGWVVTVRNGSEVLGSLELQSDPKAEGGVRFRSFASGPVHRGLAAAVDVAAERAGRARVRLSLLRAPAVYLLALWTNDGTTDTLTPIAPAPAPLRAGEPEPARQALDALAVAAKRAVAGEETRS